MIGQMSVCDTLQVVVIRILCHSPVDKCPGEVVHRVLLVLYSLGHDFGVKVVVQRSGPNETTAQKFYL